MRIATFNVENLFDRPKILNGQDSGETKSALADVGKLDKLLKKKIYSPVDKKEIVRLIKLLTPYIFIQEDIGKLMTTTGRVVATGAADWIGGIQFKRAQFSDQQRMNTGFVIDTINADVQCLVEIEGNQALADFNREILQQKFQYHLSIDSPRDPRGIDLVIYSKTHALGQLRTNAFDRNGPNFIWSRDCLEVEIKISETRSLFLLLNHFKSKFGGDTLATKAKREAQAKRVVEIASTRYNPALDWVLVVGDLNDTPDSAPLAPLFVTTAFKDVFDIVGQPADDRWTYYFKGNPVAKRRTQIDYIFASPALAGRVQSVTIERRGMTAVALGDVPEITPFDGFKSLRTSASDHAAVIVDIDIS
jgi:predicted extracellular nuclease